MKSSSTWSGSSFGFGRLLFGVALVVALTGVGATPAAPSVHVISCQVVSSFGTLSEDSVGLAVRFANDSPSALSSIVWRAKFGAYDVDFTDDGTFSSGTRIDNFVGYERGKMLFNSGAALQDVAMVLLRVPSGANRKAWQSSIFLGGSASTEDPANCSIVRASFDDGTLWINPALPQMIDPFPVPSPTPKPSPGATATPSPTPDPSSPPGPPVTLKYCVLEVAGEPYLDLQFHNTTPVTLHRVVVRAPYSGSSVDFVDVGSYAPGQLVTHRLKGARDNAFHARRYLMAEKGCEVVSVTSDNGAVWQNPDVAASAPPLPTPVPDALDIAAARNPKWQLHGQPSPVPSPTKAY